MRILALDVGTKCGWAALTERIESGVQRFDLLRGESSGIRFLKFNHWLNTMFALVKPDLVVYEQAHHRGGYATELAVGMTTRIMETCARESVDYASVHSATLKKWATGSGRADKIAMMKRASELAGREIESDDEADAYLLLQYGIERFGENSHV